jgi:hypothetical protein
MFFFSFHNTLYGNPNRELEVRRQLLSHSGTFLNFFMTRETRSEDSLRQASRRYAPITRFGTMRETRSEDSLRQASRRYAPITRFGTMIGSPTSFIVRANGSAASEGGSVRGSPCEEPARLRLTSLRPPPAAAAPCTWGPRRCWRFLAAAWTFPHRGHSFFSRRKKQECIHQAVPIPASGMAASGCRSRA